jgi:hypothetical protein
MTCPSCDHNEFRLVTQPHPEGHFVHQVKRYCRDLGCFILWPPAKCEGHKHE